MLKKIRENLKWLDPFTYVDEYVLQIVNLKKDEWNTLIVYVI